MKRTPFLSALIALALLLTACALIPAPGKDPAPRQLTDDPSTCDEHPQWSADGAHLLFVRLDEADRASLWIVPAQGGQPLLVAENVDLGGPTDDHKTELDGGQSYRWFP